MIKGPSMMLAEESEIAILMKLIRALVEFGICAPNGNATEKDIEEIPVGLNVKDHLLLCLLDWKTLRRKSIFFKVWCKRSSFQSCRVE